ncbi:amidohydrolase [Zobellia amurskyensis]|uniref:Amidohydrolase n=1 Tax=Zobellia amurskyensis TaxID=248905 RepID=A0A7X2ZS39_9FLAO|nr:amidohydrolase [Zobellia amurskyensis]MUH35382.1 amidohydrolase [Zobellia amurskyensis]
MKPTQLLIFFLLITVSSKAQTSELGTIADQIYFNGEIYTMNDNRPMVEAVAVRADSILSVGSKELIMKLKGDKTELFDLKGKTMVPGLIEGHAHLYGIGINLLEVDLGGTKSYEEAIERVAKKAKSTPKGEWIIANGWHHDKWITQPTLVNGYPTNKLLSAAVPDHPVILVHASGHIIIINQKAMEITGINSKTPQPDGGEIVLDKNGEPSGILNETAGDLVFKFLPEPTKDDVKETLILALEECYKNGITGFHDAGSGGYMVNLYEEMASQNLIKLRLYVMLRGTQPELLEYYFKKGIQENLYDNQLTIRSIKLMADGALGSRGAWLLEEYTDAPGEHGHNVTPLEDINKIVNKAYKNGFQVGIHAIGDRATHEVLDIYESTFKTESTNSPKDARFRIEHAQHFDPADILRVAELDVILAMQAIHMSSDRPWAIDRLGEKRITEGAYIWQTLLKSGAKIVNGTDAPVEPIDPMAGFYASVSRKTLKGMPDGGYEPLQKMTRNQALRSYTLDAAYAAFQENDKGSIEVGKWADFTILDKNIMTIPENQILETKVAMTVIGGEVVFDDKKVD